MKISYIPMFRMCVLFLFQFIAVSAYSQVQEQGSLALLSLHQATGGENWENNSGWLQGPVGTWFEIFLPWGKRTMNPFGNPDVENGVLAVKVSCTFTRALASQGL